MTTQTIAQLFDLTGKGAIVTGGAMGIGQGIACRLAEAGASVMITDIDLGAANRTVEQINARGGRAHAIHADVSVAADAKKVAKTTVTAFGSLDILVNNAGVYTFSPVLETSEEIWDRHLDVNLKGLFFYSQAAAQEMIKAGRGGKIVNIASMDAIHPLGQLAHYDASKAGVVMVTKSLALELAPYNILVNAIAPGAINTPMARASVPAIGWEPGEVMKKEALVRFPLGRWGEPDDIAKVVLFLASAAADYMTGSLLLVEGGYLLT